MGHGVEDMKYRFQWNYPLFYSKHNTEKLYAFSNHVHVSTDFGVNWQTISPDLTTNDTTKQGPSGGPITKDNTAVEYYCTIFAAAEAVKNADILWTGSDDGLIHITRNGGENWENITPKHFQNSPKSTVLKPIPLMKVDFMLLQHATNGVIMNLILFYTSDYGKSWKRIDKGIDRRAFYHEPFGRFLIKKDYFLPELNMVCTSH